jgi:hypothetical protein
VRAKSRKENFNTGNFDDLMRRVVLVKPEKKKKPAKRAKK